jgi:argininosuccinate synthase
LDSTTIIKWLSSGGVKITAIVVDVGQSDEKNLNDVVRRMKAAGAEEAIVVDGKKVLAEFMTRVIQGLAHHEGGYMNTTGIARMATVSAALPEIKKRGIKVITHGATGRGNDQVRFELATAMLAPEIKVYAPWRDPEFIQELGGRKEMIEFCRKHGLKVSATIKKPYSTDSNFCGLTHEAGKLESLNTPTDFADFAMGISPQKAPDKGEKIVIKFNKGVPVSINGKPSNLIEIFMRCNRIAGRNGIGIGIDVVENRRVGIKSRGVYESPGVTLLEDAYSRILQLILDREHRKFFDVISRKLADVVYEGEWFSPLAEDLLAVVKNISLLATGTVTLNLYKGNIQFLKIDGVPHSLYNQEHSSMEKVGDFNHVDSQGYLNIAGLMARTLSVTGQCRIKKERGVK